MSYIVLNMDRIEFALFFTELTSDTSGGTNLLNCRSAVFVGAAYGVDRLIRNDLDQVFRTYSNTFAAGFTLVATRMMTPLTMNSRFWSTDR